MSHQRDYLSTTAFGRGFVGHEPRRHDIYAEPLVRAAARVAFQEALVTEVEAAPATDVQEVSPVAAERV
jgi:hypothetical protein